MKKTKMVKLGFKPFNPQFENLLFKNGEWFLGLRGKKK